MAVVFADGFGRPSVLMPSARLLRRMKDELRVTCIYSLTSSPPCLRRLLILAQARESMGQTSLRRRQHWCTDLLLESMHDYQPALPQASLGMRELEILWRKQRTGESSPKALQTHVPVPSQFFASFTVPLHTRRSLGVRNQVSSKRLISAQLNAGCHMACPNSFITCDRVLHLLAQTKVPIILLGFS